MRENTERAEAVLSGNARIIGTRRESIVAEATLLLRDDAHRARMSRPSDVFGDGRASVKIAEILGSL
jgi:UDP-N-acetylglucosamine 2-epimerase (non-hydrolysing)